MTMRLLPLMLIASSMFGQGGVLTITGAPANVKGGVPFTVNVTSSGGAGYSIAAFTLVGTNDVAAVTIAPGAVATATGKVGQCGGLGAAKDNCIVGGFGATLNNTAMVDGVVAVMTITLIANPVGTTLPLSLAPVSGSDANGNLVATTAGAGITIPILNKCDVNQSGAVNGTDVGLVINAFLAQAVAAGTDLDSDGKMTLADVVIVLVAALGGVCTAH